MPLDDRLRADLPRVTPPPTDVAASLATVTRRGRRRRRARAIAPVGVVVVLALVFVAVGRQRTESSLSTVTAPSGGAVLGSTIPSTAGAPTTASTGTTSSSPVSLVPSPPPSVVPTSAPATSTTAPRSTPSPLPPVTTSTPGSVPVDLTFTGVRTGRVTSATVAPAGIVLGPHDGVDPTPACTNALPPDPSAPNRAVFGVQGILDGQPFLLAYSVGDVGDVTHGLSEGIAIVGRDTLGYADALWYDPTQVVVDGDRLGGRVDADLHDATGVVGHVTGHLRCAP